MSARTQQNTRDKVVITNADFERLRMLGDLQQYRATQSHLLVALNAKLAASEAVLSNEVDANIVTMRSQVRIRNSRSDEDATFTLVYPDEANLDEGKVSVLAPLGLALLGSAVGQTIQVATPGGERCVKIDAILYQPEQSGAFHL